MLDYEQQIGTRSRLRGIKYKYTLLQQRNPFWSFKIYATQINTTSTRKASVVERKDSLTGIGLSQAPGEYGDR